MTNAHDSHSLKATPHYNTSHSTSQVTPPATVQTTSQAQLLFRPKALLFDHDGVLVASEPLHWQAWSELFKSIGLYYDEPHLRSLIGKTAPEILKETFSRQRPGLVHSAEELLAFATQKNGFYLELLPTQLKLYDGVLDCLQWAKSESIKMCVVSNARRKELRAALESLNIAAYFDEILSREELPKPKPDAMAYLTGVAFLQLDPSECLAIEDSPTGLESALCGDVPCVGIQTNFSFEALLSPVPSKPHLKPRAIFKTFREFFEALKSTSE